MRFSIAAVGAFAAVAVAQSGSATKSETPSQTVSLDPVQSSMYACVDKCDAGDVECQSHCIAVPAPNEDQVNETTKCMAKCEQGNGTEAETARYAECQQKCITQHFYVTSEGTPSATGSPSNGGSGNDDSDSDASGSASSGAARPTNSSGSDSEDSDSTSTSGSSGSSTAAPASETSAPADSGASTLVGSGAAIFGLLAAIFAL